MCKSFEYPTLPMTRNAGLHQRKSISDYVNGVLFVPRTYLTFIIDLARNVKTLTVTTGSRGNRLPNHRSMEQLL